MIPFWKRLKFWHLVALSLLAYLLLPLVFPLIGQYNRAPLRDVRSFAPSWWAGVAYAILFVFLYATYTVAWRQLSRNGDGVPPEGFSRPIPALGLIVAATLIFCLPLLFTYPINATDIFRYFIRGRVTSFYGESALSVPPAAFPQDPYLPLAGEWAGETSPYGPLWELLAAGITTLSGHDLFAGILLFKLLAIVAHIGIAILIWHMGHDLQPSRRGAATLLWCWNPALLFMFAIDGHNDALMLFWLVLGFALMRRWPIAGFLVALLGALTKPIALITLPFLFIGHLRTIPTWAGRWRYLLIVSAGAAALTLAAFAPFGSPLELAKRLITEASGAVGFSPGILLLLLAQRIQPGIDITQLIELGAAAGIFLFILLAIFLLWRTWHGMHPAISIAKVFAAYLVTALTFRIWYSTWPFAWAILDDEASDRSKSTAFWFLLTAHLSLLIYGYLRVALLAGDQAVAHLIGVPFTFVLPFLLARWLPLSSLAKQNKSLSPTPG